MFCATLETSVTEYVAVVVSPNVTEPEVLKEFPTTVGEPPTRRMSEDVTVFRETSTSALDHTETVEFETVESAMVVTIGVTGSGANRRRLRFAAVSAESVMATESVGRGAATVDVV